MAYTVILLRPARKALEDLDDATARRMEAALAKLEADPRSPGCEKMAGQDDHWRIRVGKYRVIYTIQDRELLVLVVQVGHRREVYR